MASKFDFKSVFFAGLLLSGCGSDTAPQGDDQQTNGATAHTKDAGAKSDAGKKDAGTGKKDAGSSSADDDVADDDTADDDDTGEPADDDADDDTTEPVDAGSKADAGTKVDAGTIKADAGTTKADAGGAAGGDCAQLTYEAFGKSFLDTYCITCHATMKPTFKTLAEVTTNKAKMKAEVTAKAMPPKGQKAPTDAERTQFAKFIDCGPK
jgi:hypothetical protein